MEKLETIDKEKLHNNAVSKEQEQVKELMRRGALRHYFLGPENIWSQEGFGTVMGGVFFTILGGILLPKLFLYSTNNMALKYVCWFMTAVGILLLAKGLYKMLKESKMVQKSVSDEVHDEILDHDIERIKDASKILLMKNIPKIIDEEIDDMEMIFIKGPREYVENVNLPLVWKLGNDGKIRYSNFSVMAIYLGMDHLYIYTCIFNMRNGTIKFQHSYEAKYVNLKAVGVEDRVIEIVTQQNKALTQRLQMFVIKGQEEENTKLEMAIIDYNIAEKLMGYFDTSDVEAAVKLITNKINN